LVETDGDPCRDPHDSGHDRHRRRELFAVAGASAVSLAEEPDEVVGAVARGGVDVVAETAVLTEPLLQGHGLLEPGVLVAGDLEGEVAHGAGNPVRQVDVVAADQPARRRGAGHRQRRELELHSGHGVGEAGGVQVVVAGEEVHGVPVVAPVTLGSDL
jgi:hypothetical protein